MNYPAAGKMFTSKRKEYGFEYRNKLFIENKYSFFFVDNQAKSLYVSR